MDITLKGIARYLIDRGWVRTQADNMEVFTNPRLKATVSLTWKSPWATAMQVLVQLEKVGVDVSNGMIDMIQASLDATTAKTVGMAGSDVLNRILRGRTEEVIEASEKVCDATEEVHTVKLGEKVRSGNRLSRTRPPLRHHASVANLFGSPAGIRVGDNIFRPAEWVGDGLRTLTCATVKGRKNSTMFFAVWDGELEVPQLVSKPVGLFVYVSNRIPDDWTHLEVTSIADSDRSCMAIPKLDYDALIEVHHLTKPITQAESEAVFLPKPLQGMPKWAHRLSQVSVAFANGPQGLIAMGKVVELAGQQLVWAPEEDLMTLTRDVMSSAINRRRVYQFLVVDPKKFKMNTLGGVEVLL